MGAKEFAVQSALADQGYSTPAVRLLGEGRPGLSGTRSIMDFAAGTPPLGNLDGLAALRGAPRLLKRLPDQLATAAAGLHDLDPAPVSRAVTAAAPGVVWQIEDLLAHYLDAATSLDMAELAVAIQRLADRRPEPAAAVICHGDLHPFNLLIDDHDHVSVLDWTGAIRAEPAFDLAFTSLLLANPPLQAPRALGRVIGAFGSRLAHSFLTHYSALRPDVTTGSIGWNRGLHGARVLLEIAARRSDPADDSHPFLALAGPPQPLSAQLPAHPLPRSADFDRRPK